MPDTPFSIPPDSPLFPISGSGEVCFKFDNGPLWSLNTFIHWPPRQQAHCAAVAAMEWDTHYEEETGYYQARDAFRAARERMKGEAK